MYLAFCAPAPGEPKSDGPERRPRALVPLSELYPDVFGNRQPGVRRGLRKLVGRLVRTVLSALRLPS
jgi:hypothetical protein